MPLGQLLDSFFTDEWQRFVGGAAKLDPAQQRLAMLQLGQRGLLPGETATVNIPGWDEIIKLGPRYVATPAEKQAYYDARRTNRSAPISAEAKASLDYSVALRERIRTSAQPGYAQAFGEILTAVDNVQDFFSTVSTVGRLGVWGIERGFNLLSAGAEPAIAAEAGRLAARLAQQEALAAFDSALLAAVRAGEPVAAYLVGDEVARLAAQRAAVELAGKEAFQLAFRRALLGLGSKIALRIIPFVGTVLLVSDLLNLLSLLGMLAMPAYAALCKGPEEALAAGVPAAVFKNALKRETWKMHTLNPFSRQARAARLARAAGRLPNVSNLLEVAQTTENLFGIGVTLGGLTGAMMESAFAVIRANRGDATTLNVSGAAGSFTDPSRATATTFGKTLAGLGGQLSQMLTPRTSSMSVAELVKNQQAATTMAVGPAILGVQETFDDETHLKAIIAYAAAVSTLAPLLKGLPWQELAAELADVVLVAPWPPSPDTVQWAHAAGYDLDSSHRWWWPGASAICTGAEYADHALAAVGQATRDFFIPRRNTVQGAFYGGVVNQTTEALFLMLEEDPTFLKWELTTDARLVSSMAEAGRLIKPDT